MKQPEFYTSMAFCTKHAEMVIEWLGHRPGNSSGGNGIEMRCAYLIPGSDEDPDIQPFCEGALTHGFYMLTRPSGLRTVEAVAANPNEDLKNEKGYDRKYFSEHSTK